MNSKHIGQKIAQMRESAGLNQSELARRVGVSAQAVQKWEAQASTPRVTKMPDIAAALGVDLRDLVSGTLFAVPFLSDVRTQVAEAGKPQSYEPRPHSWLPLISWVQAGVWTEMQQGIAAEEAEDWLPCPFKHSKEAFVLRVVGDSMYDPLGPKSYAPGEFIAVDPHREPINRSMVVVRLENEDKATFKQLLIEADGTYLLKALNPDWPRRVIEMPKNSRIIGVVIGKWVAE